MSEKLWEDVSHIFIPMAIETSGICGPPVHQLLGSHLVHAIPGDCNAPPSIYGNSCPKVEHNFHFGIHSKLHNPTPKQGLSCEMTPDVSPFG